MISNVSTLPALISFTNSLQIGMPEVRSGIINGHIDVSEKSRYTSGRILESRALRVDRRSPGFCQRIAEGHRRVLRQTYPVLARGSPILFQCGPNFAEQISDPIRT